MKSDLTGKQEKFAQEVVKNGGDKVAAYKAAGYSQKLNQNAMGVQADKLFNKPNINLRIRSLQQKASKIAEKKFSISVEQRLRWLDEVARGGLHKHRNDEGELSSYENLAATNKAIDIMNDMLGIDEKGSAKPVKVIIGVEDAS